ncbi:MAG: hypothetical protein AB7H90_02935 [Alphaproteobacteria bacterium]
MAIRYSVETQKIVGNAGGAIQELPKAAYIRGKVRVQVATIPLFSQANGDQIFIARLPKDGVPLGWEAVTDTSLGSSTIAIGTVHSGESAKFKAAATFTTTNTPTRMGLASAIGRDLSADTLYDINDRVTPYVDIVLTIGAADFPASGRLVIVTYYSVE